MMLKTTIRLGLALYLFWPAAGHPAYVIKLKNGNDLVTSRYWQEGGQIMFDTYGGVFGIDRNFVDRVERSKRPVDLDVALPKLSSAADEAEEMVKVDEKVPEKGQKKAVSSQEGKGGDDPILKEFSALKDRFQRRQGMLTNDLRGFMDDLVSFKKKARQSANVNDYNRQLAEINTMADEVEALLKSRAQ